jgi:hypothetical protein
MESYRQTANFLLRGLFSPVHFSCHATEPQFKGIADIENNTAKELIRLSAVIQVPFRSGNQFLGEGGLQVRVRSNPLLLCYCTCWTQDLYHGIRDKTRLTAGQHANLGRTVGGSIVQHLQKVRTEIKAHIKVCHSAM